MTATIMPNGKHRFYNLDGSVLAGGKLYTYAAGTVVPKATYFDQASTIPNTNPVILDIRGEALVRWDGAYKYVLTTAAGVVIETIDDFTPATLLLGGIFGAGLIGFNYASVYAAGSVGKWLQDLALPGGANYIGYQSGIAGTTDKTVLERLRLEAVHVEEFPGVVGDGVTNDTVAINAAIVACQAAGKMLVFGGSYAVDKILVQDAVYNFAMHSDNAQFTAVSAVAQPGLIEIVNCVDFHMTGNWRLNGADNPNYEMGICIRAQMGTAQATTRVNIYNPTFRNFPLGIGVGRFAIDLQCSEICIFGANFFKCPVAVYNAGANTGAQYVNCNIVSEANAAFPTVVEKTIWQEGGFVKVVGGEMFTNPTAPYMILQNPCQSVTYGNGYGTMNVVGCHIEANSPLMVITNARGLAAPVSDASSVSFSNCAGFCGAPAAQDWIFIADVTYEGVLTIQGNNWYSAPVRTGYNISSASPLARFSIDKLSMGKNFRNWMGGVFNGKIIHDLQPVVNAHGLGVVYGAGTTNTLKFVTNDTSNELGRYGGNYSPATGMFTVPVGGFTRAEVEVGTVGTMPGSAVAGDFYLMRNGAIVAFGSFNGVGTLRTTLYNLVAGETIHAVLVPSGSAYTADAGLYNFMHISAATA